MLSAPMQTHGAKTTKIASNIPAGDTPFIAVFPFVATRASLQFSVSLQLRRIRQGSLRIDELGDERIGGMAQQVAVGPGLHDFPLVQHGNLLREKNRFTEIVGDQ